MEYIVLTASIIWVLVIFITFMTTASVPTWMLLVGFAIAMSLLIFDGTSSSSIKYMEDDDYE